MQVTHLLDAPEKRFEDLPAITVIAAAMLADANIKIQQLTKALAHLGCSCVVKHRSVELEDHTQFCRFRMKIEDML